LWSIHPKYLDAQGLVALWREALLAQAVLRGRTRGYRHHPQLQRFRAQRRPLSAIAAYLAEVHAEATRRGYSFDRRRIGRFRAVALMEVTTGQLQYEWRHLRSKLRTRSPAAYRACRGVAEPAAHPLFSQVAHNGTRRRHLLDPSRTPPRPVRLVTPGPVSDWERPRQR
jgi:hypothetical protein